MGEEQDVVRDVKKALGEDLLEDEVATAVRKLREVGGKSLVSAEWTEDDGLLMFRGKVYVPDVCDLRRRIVVQHHDS